MIVIGAFIGGFIVSIAGNVIWYQRTQQRARDVQLDMERLLIELNRD